jgi:hypothetical protein
MCGCLRAIKFCIAEVTPQSRERCRVWPRPRLDRLTSAAGPTSFLWPGPPFDFAQDRRWVAPGAKSDRLLEDIGKDLFRLNAQVGAEVIDDGHAGGDIQLEDVLLRHIVELHDD